MDSKENTNKKVKRIDVTKRKTNNAETLGEVDYIIKNANQLGEIEKFHSSKGHGFAAEQAPP